MLLGLVCNCCCEGWDGSVILGFYWRRGFRHLFQLDCFDRGWAFLFCGCLECLLDRLDHYLLFLCCFRYLIQLVCLNLVCLSILMICNLFLYRLGIIHEVVLMLLSIGLLLLSHLLNCFHLDLKLLIVLNCFV